MDHKLFEKIDNFNQSYQMYTFTYMSLGTQLHHNFVHPITQISNPDTPKLQICGNDLSVQHSYIITIVTES
jgi:hypothetical protein